MKERDKLVSQRRLLVDTIVLDRQRFPSSLEVLLVEDRVDLKVTRRITDDAFGASVRKVVKMGKGRIPLAIVDILNVV